MRHPKTNGPGMGSVPIFRPSKGVSILLIFLVWGMLCDAPGAAAALGRHDPPPIWLDFTLQETQLDCKLRVMVPCFDDWMHTRRAQRMKATAEEREEHKKAIVDWFRRYPLVAIDGIEVAPTVENLKFVTVEDHQIRIDYVEVDLGFSIKARPKKVKLSWGKWDIFPTWPLGGMDALFAWDDEQIAIGLLPEEPVYVWHAPPRAKGPPPLPDPPPPPPRIDVPLLSVACLAGLLFFVPLSFLLRLHLRVRWGGVLVLIVLAMSLRGTMVRSMRPFWIEDAKLPTIQEAKDIFAALQQNTYRAFDYDDEERVYDVLARSVDGALLERLYSEIFESLVLREDGGAVCKVRKVEILESDISLPDDPENRSFKVKAKWRVVGRVGHYGHEHIRVTQYMARYTLSEREQGWRISAVEVLNQRRIDPGDLGLEK